MDNTHAADPRRLRLTIIATSLGFVLVQLDATIVNVGLARIGTSFGVGVAALEWIVDAYSCRRRNGGPRHDDGSSWQCAPIPLRRCIRRTEHRSPGGGAIGVALFGSFLANDGTSGMHQSFVLALVLLGAVALLALLAVTIPQPSAARAETSG